MDPRPGLSIVEATTADAGAIGEFLRTAWAESGQDAPGFAGATDDVIDELARPEAIGARLGGPVLRIFIGVVDDNVVGFASTRVIDDDDVELSGIIVRPHAAGTGVGTGLIEAAVAAMAAERRRRMVVRTETDNTRARGFYESRGFRSIGPAVEDVDGVTVDVWELERRLPG